MNTASTIIGLIFTFPFLALALLLASITTFIINIGRLTIISVKYVYRASLTFFRHLIRSNVDQETAGSTEGGGGSTSAATIASANRDATTTTNTTFDTS